MKSSTIIGGAGKNGRQKDDFYGTPRQCTVALLEKEQQYLSGNTILEPCAGKGAISEVCLEYGYDVVSWELVDRGYGETGVDYFTRTETNAKAIVTNPPYKLAEQFIRHSREVLEVPYVAMLLKSQYWHSIRRQTLWRDHPPQHIYALTWRPDFMGMGSPTMDFSWIVWRPDGGPCTYSQMERPV